MVSLVDIEERKRVLVDFRVKVVVGCWVVVRVVVWVGSLVAVSWGCVENEAVRREYGFLSKEARRWVDCMIMNAREVCRVAYLSLDGMFERVVVRDACLFAVEVLEGVVNKVVD